MGVDGASNHKRRSDENHCQGFPGAGRRKGQPQEVADACEARLTNVLAVCSAAETEGERIVDIAVMREQTQQHFEKLSSKGFRTLGFAYKIWELPH